MSPAVAAVTMTVFPSNRFITAPLHRLVGCKDHLCRRE